MAIPEQQFQDIIEQIEQTVTETISKTLKQLQLPASDNFDPLIFRMQLMQDIDQKLMELKAQLLANSGQTAPPVAIVPAHKETWQEWIIDVVKMAFFLK